MGQPQSSVAEDSSRVGELCATSPESVEVEPELQNPQDSLPAGDPELPTPALKQPSNLSCTGLSPACQMAEALARIAGTKTKRSALGPVPVDG